MSSPDIHGRLWLRQEVAQYRDAFATAWSTMSLSMCCLCIVEPGHVRRKGVHRKYKTLSVVSGQDCRVLSITSVVFYRHELALARLDKGGKSATAPLFAARLHLRALGDRVGARRARAILARCSRRWQVRGASAITCSAPRALSCWQCKLAARLVYVIVRSSLG